VTHRRRVSIEGIGLLALLTLAVIACVAQAQPARKPRPALMAEDFSATAPQPIPASGVVHDAKAINRRTHTPSIAIGKNNTLVLALLDYPPPGGKVAADMDSTNNIKFAKGNKRPSVYFERSAYGGKR